MQAGDAATASPLSPHASHPRTMNRQRTDLEETFGEPLDDDDDDFDDSNESRRLLGTASASSSSSSTAIPVQQPPPPPPHPSTNHRQQHQPAVLPVTNDGVFANMSAKPEREADKLDETPPVSEQCMVSMDTTDHH